MATTVKKVPELGYGGADYNTAGAAMKKQIAQNQMNIANNDSYRQSEIQRALQTIAAREAAGQDTSSQQKYLNVNLGYNAPSANTSNTAATTNTGTSTSNTAQNKTSQSSELMEMMRQIATRESTPFNYNPNSDPAYQAALKRAQANIAEGNSAAQAEMNRRGILNSTITSDRMGEIASNEMGRVETDVLPSLMQQAYQQYLDQENMRNQQLSNLDSVAQMYINEDQRGIDNQFATADRTGYMPASEEARNLVNQLMSLKEQAESTGITAAERNKLSNQADGIRAMLSQMGVDASQYGSNVNYNTASQIAPTIRTLGGQQLDLSRQNQEFNQNFAQEQFAYQKARDAISDQQWQAIFDRDVQQFGLNYGLNVLQENNQQAYRQAQLALSQDDNTRAWAQLDYQMSQPSSSGSSGGLTTNQVVSIVKNQYVDDKGKIPSDQKENAFLSVVDMGLDDKGTNQALLGIGLTQSEISSFLKKFGGTSGN